MPRNVQAHLAERMLDRGISKADLSQLRVWLDSQPDAPEGEWYKDFGSFKLFGSGFFPKTFLFRGQVANGDAL